MAEWDVVSESADGKRLLLGEAKWSARPFTKASLGRALRALHRKPDPSLPSRFAGHDVVRVLFVPTVPSGIKVPNDVPIVTAASLLG